MPNGQRGLVLVAFLALLIVPLVCLGATKNKANEIKKAEHFLVKFEKDVQQAGGKPFPLKYDHKEAMKRVRALKEEFPDDPDVEALFQRTKKCVEAGEGKLTTITPEMLAYKENEKKLVKKLAGLNEEEWQKELTHARDSGRLLEKAFPAADPMASDPDEIIGKFVLLEDFAYPENEFMDTNQQYVFIGSGARGFYFAHLSNRSWLGAYEALKRYRRQVSELGEAKWTVLGEITSVNLLVPQAGEEKTLSAHWGWIVKPRAIYIPGMVVAIADPENEQGGFFGGESNLQAIKAEFYTYSSVPENVEPQELVKIFATAIKEKNWDLYLECIDPARKKTKTAIQRLRYFYDNNQERYHRFYVYVDPYELVSIKVRKGFDAPKGSDKDFFLDKEQKEKIKEHSGPTQEEAIVMIRTFDEKGKQTALPKKVSLYRYDGGRWYVGAGYPL